MVSSAQKFQIFEFDYIRNTRFFQRSNWRIQVRIRIIRAPHQIGHSSTTIINNNNSPLKKAKENSVTKLMWKKVRQCRRMKQLPQDTTVRRVEIKRLQSALAWRVRDDLRCFDRVELRRVRSAWLAMTTLPTSSRCKQRPGSRDTRFSRCCSRIRVLHSILHDTFI